MGIAFMALFSADNNIFAHPFYVLQVPSEHPDKALEKACLNFMVNGPNVVGAVVDLSDIMRQLEECKSKNDYAGVLVILEKNHVLISHYLDLCLDYISWVITHDFDNDHVDRAFDILAAVISILDFSQHSNSVKSWVKLIFDACIESANSTFIQYNRERVFNFLQIYFFGYWYELGWHLPLIYELLMAEGVMNFDYAEFFSDACLKIYNNAGYADVVKLKALYAWVNLLHLFNFENDTIVLDKLFISLCSLVHYSKIKMHVFPYINNQFEPTKAGHIIEVIEYARSVVFLNLIDKTTRKPIHSRL